MFCDDYSGSHYDIGLAMGRRHAPWIERTLAQFVAPHAHEFQPDELKRLEEKWLGLLGRKAPCLLEQIRGVSDGSGVPLSDLLAMNFRFWNIATQRRIDRFQMPEAACTNIAFRDPDRGILLGGTLDDIRLPYLLANFAPRGKLRHLCVTWIGSAWGARGVNEAGLAVGGSSMPVDGIEYAMDERFEDLATKLVLEEARTADEAMALFRSLGPFKGISIVFADRAGNVRLLETCWAGEAVHELDGTGVLFCVNHPKSPVLLQKMLELGYTNQTTCWSRNRERQLQEFQRRVDQPRDFGGMRQLLSSHDSYPQSICCPSAVYHTIAAPQDSPGAMWVADGPSCRRPLEQLLVAPSARA